MNENGSHWLLKRPSQFACGYVPPRTLGAAYSTDIQYVTCPACRAVWQGLIDGITATPPTKHKRG